MLEHIRILLHQDETQSVLTLSLILVALVLTIAMIVQSLRLRRLSKRLESLTRGASGENLEQTLNAHLDALNNSMAQMERQEKILSQLQAQLPLCVQQVKLTRFDAFEDVGGEQSFAVAMLDAKGDGLILSSAYSRQDVRVYAKTIKDGKPSHSLSREEAQVVSA